MDIRKLQRAIVDGLEDVKGQDILVFNTEHLSALFERVIIASGTSNRQTKSLASGVRAAVREAGFPVLATEGAENGEWIIVDCGAAVAHIMQPAIREYYRLEDLWGGKPVKMKLGDSTRGLVKASEPDDDEEDDEPRKKAPAKKAAAKKTAAKPVESRQAVAQKQPVGAARKTVATKLVKGKSVPVKAPVKSAVKPAVKAAAKSAAKKAPARKTVAAKEPAVQKVVVKTAVRRKVSPAAPAPRRAPPAAAPVARKVAPARKVATAAAPAPARKAAPARKTAPKRG